GNIFRRRTSLTSLACTLQYVEDRNRCVTCVTKNFGTATHLIQRISICSVARIRHKNRG
ncbi:unnamed protein product, partial [Amoebophrya sp. A25]